jgi:hypothetical protein
MRRYATTASGTQKLCADEGDVATTSPVPVEGYHVVTLFAQNYDPPSSVRASHRTGAHGLRGSTLAAGTRVRLYRPNGAVAATLTGERPNSWPATLAPGTYWARAENGHAAVVVLPGRHSVAK